MAIDITRFIPYQIKNYPLYKDVVIPIFNYILGTTEEQFKYITDKYTKYEQLDPAVATELIYELGYGYLLDNINLNSEDVRIIFGYLKLFHILKGRKDGLRFVIELSMAKAAEGSAIAYSFANTQLFVSVIVTE